LYDLLRWISSDEIVTSAGDKFDNQYTFLQSMTGGDSSSLKYEIDNEEILPYPTNLKIIKN